MTTLLDLATYGYVPMQQQLAGEMDDATFAQQAGLDLSVPGHFNLLQQFRQMVASGTATLDQIRAGMTGEGANYGGPTTAPAINPMDAISGATIGGQSLTDLVNRGSAFIVPENAETIYAYSQDGGGTGAVFTNAEREEIEDDFRTRRLQGSARVGALVGGAAALANTPWGMSTPGAGVGAAGAAAGAEALTGVTTAGTLPINNALPFLAGTPAASSFGTGAITSVAAGTAANAAANAARGGLGGSGGSPTNASPGGSGSGLGASGGGIDWAQFLPGIIGGVASLYGNNQQQEAIDRATAAQQAGIDKGLEYARETRDQILARQQPFHDAAVKATGALTDMAGLTANGYNWQTDPGYQFRIDEGMKALENSAAARGGLLSGGFGKAALKYATDYSAQEYTNVYNRIASIAGMNQTSGPISANAGSQYGANATQLATMGGANNASGYMASGNATASMLNEVATAFGDIDWNSMFGNKSK